MLQGQRQHLAELATERIAALFHDQPGAFYRDSVHQKLILLLQAVDCAALAVSSPLLVAGAIPGFDLVIMRNPDAPAPAADATVDPRMVSVIDETCLDLLGKAVEKTIAESGQSGEAGAFIYQGGDGLHYFGFRTEHRAAVLKQLGISEDGVIHHATGSGMLQ